MKFSTRLLACAALAMALTSPARAQQQVQGVTVLDGPIYTMTYVEVVPSATARGIAAMKQYRDASRKEPGASSIDIYQEKGQSHRFVISEVWQNRANVEAHSKAAASAAMARTLKPIQLGPVDMRIHQIFAATPPKAPKAGDIFIISHVDVAGGNTQNLINQLGPLGEASRKEPGMVRFEILDEVPAHANHFRMFEEWADAKAWEAHNLAAPNRSYHEALMPMLGTPYDQRLYTLVN